MSESSTLKNFSPIKPNSMSEKTENISKDGIKKILDLIIKVLILVSTSITAVHVSAPVAEVAITPEIVIDSATGDAVAGLTIMEV